MKTASGAAYKRVPARQEEKSGLLSRLENAIFGRLLAKTPALVPGLLLASLVLAAAVVLADYVNTASGHKGLVSYILAAIVIGLIVGNTIKIPDVFAPGISFLSGETLAAPLAARHHHDGHPFEYFRCSAHWAVGHSHRPRLHYNGAFAYYLFHPAAAPS